MGVLRPIVHRAQSDRPQEGTPSKRLVTPANLMSVSRPVLGEHIASKLRNGEKGVIGRTMIMAATDMEGSVAKFFDKHFPELHIGASEIGAPLDTWCDTIAMIEVARAAIVAPRVSMLGKAAVGIMLGQETHKTAWAINSARKFYQRNHELLRLPVDEDGKESMAEKLVALCAAIATNDVEDPRFRTVLGLTAVGFAVSGTIRAEGALDGYQQTFVQMMTDATLLE